MIWDEKGNFKQDVVDNKYLCSPVFKLKLSDISFASAASTFIDSDHHFIEAPDGMYLKREYKNLKQVDVDSKFNIKNSALEDNKLVLDYEHGQKDAYIVVCAIHKDGKEKTLTARVKINQEAGGRLKMVHI